MTDAEKCAFMDKALKLAREAFNDGEVPIGAVVVQNGKVIANGRNRREIGKNALLHAEIEAIDNACRLLGGWRLPRCEMFVTLEPCPMCAWAAILSGVSKIVFGAYDMNAGALGSFFNLSVHPSAKNTEIYGGICEKECAVLLKEFFRGVRKNENKTF